jgi:YbbR domain-containing protein
VAYAAGVRVNLGRTGPAVTRALGVLVHNWPLKLAAIGLATLLYGGLVLSQSTASLTGVVPVDVRNQPVDTFLLQTVRPVTEIRYVSPAGVRPITSDFEAWIDLGAIEPGSGPRSVNIQIRSVDPRITVVGFDPQVVTVELDRLAVRSVPVEVERGDAPTGLELGPTAVAPKEVEVRGPASVISRVVAARADVIIQPSGIDVDQDVELVPVDAVGDAVAQVRLDPSTARVTIPVFSDRESKTLPISPLITGEPASGFEFVTATVDPHFVTVEGDIDELEAMTTVDTGPISVNGLSADQEVEANLALPSGVVALDVEAVRVAITVRPITASRSFDVGLRLVGARPDRTYATSVDRVLITVGGSVVDLDRLSAATLVADLQVGTLVAGSTAVEVDVDLPAGVTLVASSPGTIIVTVGAGPPAPPSAAPGSSPSAAASPSG